MKAIWRDGNKFAKITTAIMRKEVMTLKKMKMIGMAGFLLSGAATLIGSWVQEKQMEETIEEKVNEALTAKSDKESH